MPRKPDPSPFALLDRSYDLTKELELVPLTDLKRHPKNYQQHPQEEIDHLAASLRRHGWYKNIVIARDNTILAGHGLVEAAGQIGLTFAVAGRRDLDPMDPDALALVAGDNEIGRQALRDEPALALLLEEVRERSVQGLAGTGYNEEMLQALMEREGNIHSIPEEPTGPEEFPAYDEDIETEHTCPKCGYMWSGQS